MPRPQFTMRRMMVVVALVGAVLAYERWLLEQCCEFAGRSAGRINWDFAIGSLLVLNVGTFYLAWAIIYAAVSHARRRRGLRACSAAYLMVAERHERAALGLRTGEYLDGRRPAYFEAWSEARAAYHDAMAAKYHRAALRPRLPVSPDPPMP